MEKNVIGAKLEKECETKDEEDEGVVRLVFLISAPEDDGNVIHLARV